MSRQPLALLAVGGVAALVTVLATLGLLLADTGATAATRGLQIVVGVLVIAMVVALLVGARHAPHGLRRRRDGHG